MNEYNRYINTKRPTEGVRQSNEIYSFHVFYRKTYFYKFPYFYKYGATRYHNKAFKNEPKMICDLSGNIKLLPRERNAQVCDRCKCMLQFLIRKLIPIRMSKS